MSYPGTFLTNFTIFEPLTIGPDRTFEPGFTPFNFGPWVFYQRSGRRWTGGGFADVEISDAFKPYVEVMYMNDRTLSQFAPSGNFQNTETINCDNPLLSAQQKSLVCFDGNFFGQNTIFDDDGNWLKSGVRRYLSSTRSPARPISKAILRSCGAPWKPAAARPISGIRICGWSAASKGTRSRGHLRCQLCVSACQVRQHIPELLFRLAFGARPGRRLGSGNWPARLPIGH